METQSYEVQVMKNRKWEVARVFTPDDKATADSLYVSLSPGMGYEGKKLIAEVMDGEGMVRARLGAPPPGLARQPRRPAPIRSELCSRSCRSSERGLNSEIHAARHRPKPRRSRNSAIP